MGKTKYGEIFTNFPTIGDGDPRESPSARKFSPSFRALDHCIEKKFPEILWEFGYFLFIQLRFSFPSSKSLGIVRMGIQKPFHNHGDI